MGATARFLDHLQSTFASSTEGLIVMGPDRRIVSMNSFCAELLGVRADPLIGTTCPARATGPDANRASDSAYPPSLAPTDALFSGQTPVEAQRAKIRRPDGSEAVVLAAYVAVQLDPNVPAHILGIVRPAEPAGDTPIFEREFALGVLSSTAKPPNLDNILESVEREAIRAALRTTRGRRTDAAQLLGISRSRLYRRLELLGTDIPSRRRSENM